MMSLMKKDSSTCNKFKELYQNIYSKYEDENYDKLIFQYQKHFTCQSLVTNNKFGRFLQKFKNG